MNLVSIDSVIKLLSVLYGIQGTKTPYALAKEMVDKLPVDWSDKSVKVLDPDCAYGVFLLAALRKMVECGDTVENAVKNRLYGIEGDGARFKIATAAFKKITNVKPNIFSDVSYVEMDEDMKFQVIVGNPPYQESDKKGKRKDQASNLWSKFWAKSIKTSTDDGIVALVTPTSWLSPSSDLKKTDSINGMDRLWDIFNSYKSYANVKDVAKYFPGVGSTFGYVIVDKSKKDGLEFSDGSDTSLGFLPKSDIDLVKKHLCLDENIGKYFKVDQSNKPNLRVSVPLTRGLDEESIEILKGVSKPTKGSEKEKLYVYVYVDNQYQAEVIKKSIIDAIPVLNVHCRWNGFLNIKTLKTIKLPSNWRGSSLVD